MEVFSQWYLFRPLKRFWMTRLLLLEEESTISKQQPLPIVLSFISCTFILCTISSR